MNINLALNGLSTTVDGNPINIEHAEISCELTTQEIATGGGLISALSREFKPLIKEAVKPVVTPAITTAPTNRNYNNNHKNNNYNKGNNYNKNDNRKDIQKTFSEITKPECLTAKDAEWRWKTEATANNRCSVCVQNDEFNVVRIHIMTNATWVHIHKYPSETKIDGCRFDQLPEFLKWSGMPEELQSYIMKVVAL